MKSYRTFLERELRPAARTQAGIAASPTRPSATPPHPRGQRSEKSASNPRDRARGGRTHPERDAHLAKLPPALPCGRVRRSRSRKDMSPTRARSAAGAWRACASRWIVRPPRADRVDLLRALLEPCPRGCGRRSRGRVGEAADAACVRAAGGAPSPGTCDRFIAGRSPRASAVRGASGARRAALGEIRGQLVSASSRGLSRRAPRAGRRAADHPVDVARRRCVPGPSLAQFSGAARTRPGSPGSDRERQRVRPGGDRVLVGSSASQTWARTSGPRSTTSCGSAVRLETVAITCSRLSDRALSA